MWQTEKITVATALQLLGPEFPDIYLRTFAVQVLSQQLSSELLEMYLLQLTQVTFNT